jgi:hypothetical protein
LCVRAPWIDVAPITDGNSDQIETGVLDLPEVIERDETVPVRLEYRGTLVLSDSLA